MSRGTAATKGRTSNQGSAPETKSPAPATRNAAPATRSAGRVTRSTGPVTRSPAPTTTAPPQIGPLAEQHATSDQERRTNDHRRVDECHPDCTLCTIAPSLAPCLALHIMPLPSRTDYCFLATPAHFPALLVIHAPLLHLPVHS